MALEITDIVKKCKTLLLDIEGTTTSISFVKDKLFPYALQNVKQYLDSQWETDDVKQSVAALKKLADDDKENNVDGTVVIPAKDASKEEQISALVDSVKWLMSSDRKAGPLKQLQGLIWKQGYDNGDIKGHIFDDVLPALEQWRSMEDHKVYIYSSGSVQAQKLLFAQSTAGNLLKHIDGHFDTEVGAKRESTSYVAIAEKIGCEPDKVLFLTDIVQEAEAARSAGLHVALVSRDGNAELSVEDKSTFPVITSFAQMTTTSNKRKPDQDVEMDQPAKIPKTESKEVAEGATEDKLVTKVDEKEIEKIEKMEVESDNIESNSNESKKVETDKEEIKEVVEEKETESNAKTEKMQTDESVEDKIVDVPKGATDVKTDENSPQAVMEENITNKLNGDKAAEDSKDVKIPSTDEDIEILQNVGEVLEKECDDILAKVQGVTNLDNIAVKPLLNPIPEETMDAENTDSNDIVDNILDSELELEMKQCQDVDTKLKAEVPDVAKVSSEKTITNDKEKTESKEQKTDMENKSENVPISTSDKEKIAEENKVSDHNATETKIEKVPTKSQNQSEVADNDTETSKDIESKTETVEKKPETIKTVEQKIETVEQKVELVEQIVESVEQKVEPVEQKVEPVDQKVEPVEQKVESVEQKVKSVEKSVESVEQKVETVANKAEKVETADLKEETIEKKSESNEEKVNGSSDVEIKVNGNSNGDVEKVTVNGNGVNNEDSNERLIVNGDKVKNGTNGDTAAVEMGQGDCKATEISDIKAKTIIAEETPTEQASEA